MLTEKGIILRDFIESDIDKRIYWETVETEWQQWDAPWEYEGLTEEEKQNELQGYIESLKHWVEQDAKLAQENISSKNKIRYRFQICLNNESRDYIGWCTAYCIDEEYCYTDEDGRLAVGINIPEQAMRGKGYATQALCMFIKYLLEHGEKEIFTQTWSGNERMIHVAKKIGFEECCRKKDFREVRGKKYEIDHLAVIHENFFVGSGILEGKNCHEIAFYYVMKPRGTKELKSDSRTEDGVKEEMHWISLEDLDKYKTFPNFIPEVLPRLDKGMMHIVTDDREFVTPAIMQC